MVSRYNDLCGAAHHQRTPEIKRDQEGYRTSLELLASPAPKGNPGFLVNLKALARTGEAASGEVRTTCVPLQAHE
jgi:hypothetical protein